ncbi:hypothetical protein LguiA_003106 [Lonicera macranthoides]
MAISTSESQLELIKCDSCGFTEECTISYISKIREKYQGKWICGLCDEAVKDEITRSGERIISSEEALNRHVDFCKSFRSTSSCWNDEHPIFAIGRVLRKNLDSSRSTPSSPLRVGIRNPSLLRSESCFSSLRSIHN